MPARVRGVCSKSELARQTCSEQLDRGEKRTEDECEQAHFPRLAVHRFSLIVELQTPRAQSVASTTFLTLLTLLGYVFASHPAMDHTA